MPKLNYQGTSTIYPSTPGGREPKHLERDDWATPDLPLFGLFQGENVGTEITLIQYTTDKIGAGPTLHVHPYDEIFTIQEGHARFTVGDKTIDAGPGDIVFGPANIPHG